MTADEWCKAIKLINSEGFEIIGFTENSILIIKTTKLNELLGLTNLQELVNL
jgi:hypothetical protein